MKFLKQLLIFIVIVSMVVSCEVLPMLPTTQNTPSVGTTTLPTTTNLPSGTSTTRPTTGTTTGNTTTTTTSPDVEFIPDEEEGPTSDPYVGMTDEEFYASYIPATSYMDAYYRSLHYFMSGDIEVPDQAPDIADYQPMENGLYVRNTTYLYSSDGNTYYVLDGEGNIVNKIFKGGAYITLEEVAAYVFAFGETPANYSDSKKTKPTSSPWGEYLRVNNTKFTGDTSRYPYEPELPRISGCGGDLVYYEIDIGTTGTDCDPSYTAELYNDGISISRGAARIVYTRYDRNGNKIIEDDERYLFYTYNHYNDFQEYLNYEGGWGEMFGNITGGGTISSKYDYNPTPYVEVVKREFYVRNSEMEQDEHIIELAFIYFNTKVFSIMEEV